MVRRALLEAYRRQLSSVAAGAADYVSGLMAAMRENAPGAGVAELREAAIDAIDEALNAFGDQASELARELFDEVVPADAPGPGFEAGRPIDGSMVSDAVRYAARKLVAGDGDGFDGDVRGLTEYYVRRTAFENLERSCERNGLRYARVPSGRETCAFCFMLSSRGFVYRSEATASGEHGYHEHCDCVIVPGLPEDGTVQIEGYDPERMRRRWRQCEETVGGEEESRALWEEMAADERARYKGSKDWERFRRFHRARVNAEVESRDFRWLNTGREADWDSEAGSSPSPEDEEVGRLLGSIGFSGTLCRASAVYRDRRQDALLRGPGGATVPWEFKNPSGSGKLTVWNQFKSVLYGNDKRTLNVQCDRVVIDNVRSDMTFERMCADVERILSGSDEGWRLEHVDLIREVMVLDRSGAVRRYRNKK